MTEEQLQERQTQAEVAQKKEDGSAEEQRQFRTYAIRFRPNQHPFSSVSRITNLRFDEAVMIQSDHGLEPARVGNVGSISSTETAEQPRASFFIVRRANREEEEKYGNLIEREREAFNHCKMQIEKHQLVMKLISVERYFNGSKIIFYFTAENRVDFRELVKDLVQEFRTRVEMRQIGVRHETKMVGGVGCCGRELCCSSYLKNFAPVSIKMAKEQELPLNPAKISGICNRLLCCLTYEFDTYKELKQGMPRQGKTLRLEGKTYKICQVNALQQTITVFDPETPGSTMTLTREQWQQASFEPPKKQSQKKKKQDKQENQ
ncbi:MAG: regulatory iron-sulfur-containing complex subunit RicT [Deltaproteobacteria bacterium]